ncbi:hypothetical protein UFOVP23_47 [uncultured Caudovirales phage]|uniref:Uncharacterized protein n=1 Tax=uncultured Caudovirales phage TaxID=2100421 RepID=A0A6J5T857_9CAUD|nr:hypothetical protein UFOVP23_47 [uncultured Caudovirales phage]
MYQKYARTYGDSDNSFLFLANPTSTGSEQDWFTFDIPRSARMVHFLAMAGGGGGAGGNTAAASTSANGGGGGGASSLLSALFPARVLPSILYIMPGSGGAGGTGAIQATATAATPGITGYRTLVSAGYYGQTTNRATDYLMFVYPGLGGLINGNGGAGGGLFNINPSTGSGLLTIGMSYGVAGIIGSAGGATGAGVGTVWGASVTTTHEISLGGAGGAGVNAGTTTAQGGGFSYTSQPGFILPMTTVSGGAAGGGAGSSAPFDFIAQQRVDMPFLSCGGLGGGSNTSNGTGGAGGNGGIGSGGAGGGASNGASSIGGAGGMGGGGFVLITIW